MLALLSHALTANGISHRRCKGGNSISDGLKAFKRDPDMRAVLLPFKGGSNGLNVIEATHVFLIEPLLNVAVESQAVGRVHRIGQDRPTTVHRMIVEGTVEERVRALSKAKMESMGAGSSLELVRAAAKSKETVTIDDMEALFEAAASETSARPEDDNGAPAADGAVSNGSV
jgi:E3 ubiquitin-protein ligase SHPRH